MTTYDMILKAIKHKKSIYAMFNGKPRYICPHLVGMRLDKNKPETIQALSYQYDGKTTDGRPLASAGSEDNLKFFKVDGLLDARFAEDGKWETTPSYSLERWQEKFSDVYDCLEYHLADNQDVA